MVLGFKTIINSQRTFFVEKIRACVELFWAEHYKPKKHSIRRGKRWKAGMKLHMATGTRTRYYNQFNKNIDGLQTVVSVQDIEIRLAWNDKIVLVDGRILSADEVDYLAMNDGFETIQAFWNFFAEDEADLDGQIIHWTDLRY